MMKLANDGDTWVWTFKDVKGLLDATENAIAELPGASNDNETTGEQT
jgi:hypothetical protein